MLCDLINCMTSRITLSDWRFTTDRIGMKKTDTAAQRKAASKAISNNY